MAAPDAPERLLCDTSFIAHVGVRRVKPERYMNADWGRARIAEEERRLSSFLQIPLDFPDLDEVLSRVKHELVCP